MDTYLQAKVWRKKCLGPHPPSGMCPVMYKWDCGKVRVILSRGWEQKYMANKALEGENVFLPVDVTVNPAMPYRKIKKTKKGTKAYKLRLRGQTMEERNYWK